jgi:hypothetical protein
MSEQSPKSQLYMFGRCRQWTMIEHVMDFLSER